MNLLKAYLTTSRAPLIRWNFRFFITNLPLFWLLGIYYFSHSGWPSSSLGLLFVISSIIGHFGMLAWLSIFVLSFIVTILIPKSYVTIPLAILLAFITVVYLVVDSTTFFSYRFHLNGVILQMIFSSAFTQIFAFSWFEWLLASLLILAILLLQLYLARITWKKQKNRKSLLSPVAFLVVFIFYLASQLIHAWCAAAFMYQGARYAQPIMQYSQNIPLYFGMTAKNFLLGHNLIKQVPNHNAQIANLSTGGSSGIHYPLHTIITKPKTKPLNVMLIVLDTWRYDAMNQQTTPNIYRFAQQSWQFTNHYSGGDCTEPGIFSLFYGIPASYWPDFLAEHKGPILIDELIKQHYQLGIYASASLYKPDFYQTVFVNVPHLTISNSQAHPWQRDQYITQEMLKFLAQRNKKKPFFGFLFYDAIHEYDFPPNFKTKFNPWWKTINHLALTNDFNPTPYRNRYNNAVLYVDGLVQQILMNLKQQHLLDNTVVIITADHGEEFNDNHQDYWGHASNFSHYQMQTPFIVYWPGKKPKVFHHFTSHYDVVPLLMRQVLGVTNPSRDYTIGQPLLTPGGRDVLPVSSYVFNGFIEKRQNRITTLLNGGLYRVTNDKLLAVKHGNTSTKNLQDVFEVMHRYYQ